MVVEVKVEGRKSFFHGHGNGDKEMIVYQGLEHKSEKSVDSTLVLPVHTLVARKYCPDAPPL